MSPFDPAACRIRRGPTSRPHAALLKIGPLSSLALTVADNGEGTPVGGVGAEGHRAVVHRGERAASQRLGPADPGIGAHRLERAFRHAHCGVRLHGPTYSHDFQSQPQAEARLLQGFISYSHKDADLCSALKDLLGRPNDDKPTCDSDGFVPGRNVQSFDLDRREIASEGPLQ